MKNCPICQKPVEKWGAKYCSRECYESTRNARIEVICKECGNKFLKRPSDISKCKKSTVGFCNQECFKKYCLHSFGKTNEICQECGKQFISLKNKKRKFCCYACKQKAFHKFKGSGEENQNYRKGSRYYRKRAFAHFPHFCHICKRADCKLYVHHIDESHQNNLIENLRILCQSCHVRIHTGDLKASLLDIV